jgi:putative ABC transport system permease protein
MADEQCPLLGKKGTVPFFALLLRCYPAQARDRFDVGMRFAFTNDYAAAHNRGRLHVLAFWIGAFADAVVFHASRLRAGASMKAFLITDLRDALRSLRATPVVTIVAVVSLALGIGANAALFSILNSLVFKTLPVRDPASLAIVDDGSWTNPIWEQIREHRRDLFDDAFAWSGTRFNLADHGATDYVDGAWASGGMFEVLGVRPEIGRTFSEADDVRGANAVAVISHAFWQKRFGGARDVLGRQLSIRGVSITVIGVMPPSFMGPDIGRRADVIVPIGVLSQMPGGTQSLDGRSNWWLEIMVRLRPGESIDQATARLDALQPAIRQATLPQDWPAKELEGYLKPPLKLVSASTGESELRRSYLTPLRVVLAVVAAVLLIACANLANLLLARSAARRHEMSVRMALGATRWRLAKQLIAESTLLASAGAILGLAVARWGGALLVAQLSTDQSLVTLDLSMDWRVLAFTAAVAVATTLVFGLAPVFGVNGVAPQDAIKEQSRTMVGERRFGIRNVLVAGQVALSLMLLVAAALFVRSLNALVNAPLGFNASPLLAADVTTRMEGREARLALFEGLRASAASIPGASSAALSVLNPVGSMGWNTRFEQPPGQPAIPQRQRVVWVNAVSPQWFETFGIHLVAGRFFDEHDAKGAPRVTIVSETLARRLFPGGQAVGRDVRTGLEGPEVHPFRIVGVVNDSVYRSQRAGLQPILYTPIAQLDDVTGTMVLTTRAATGDPETLTRDLADAISRTNAEVAFTIHPVSAQLRVAVRQERLVAMLGGLFGGLALVLAAVGLYGVTSYGVNRRRSEIGVRMALGADPSGVIRLVLGRLVLLLSCGVAAGLALSWWTSRFVATLLFGLGPRDPATFAAAATLLVAIGLLAGWIPARRAARIDPVRVLREQ